MNYSPCFTSIQVDADDNVYLMYEYPTIGVEKLQDEEIITLCHALLKYNKSFELIDIYPIQEFGEVNHNLFTINFQLINSNKIAAMTHDWKKWYKQILEKNPGAKILPIAEFELEGKRFEFNKHYSYALPKVYKEKYFENFIGIHICNYPYFNLYFDNKIYNLENGKSATLVEDELYKKSIDHSAEALDINSEKFGVEKFHNYKVAQNPLNNEVWSIYKWDGKIMVKIFDENLKLLKSGDITKMLYYKTPTLFEMDWHHQMIKIGFKDAEKSLSMPLGLFR